MLSVFAVAYEITVEDNANLFTSEEYNQIVSEAEYYSSQTNISLAVLTIDNAQGHTSEEYAEDFHDNLIDSEGWSEDSMLFLIDMDNRNVWVSTTGAAENVYYDVDSIIDGGFDYLAGGDYGQCILGMIDAAATDYMNYDFSDYEPYTEDYTDFYYEEYYDGASSTVDAGDILIYIIVGLGVGGISVFAVKSRYKNFGKGDEFCADDVFLNLTGSNDTVISRNVVTTKIPRNNNHHRAGGSGGARPSGGGRSHGGGGRSF